MRGSTFLSQVVGDNREGVVLGVLCGGESVIVEMIWDYVLWKAEILKLSACFLISPRRFEHLQIQKVNRVRSFPSVACSSGLFLGVLPL